MGYWMKNFMSLWRFGRVLLTVGLVASVVACSSTGDDEADYVEEPVEDLYNRAQDLMQEGDFKGAAAAFEEVDRQHPYSQWAVRAQWMSAYAYYSADDYDEAIVALQNFIDLHPGHEHVAYAYYLIGLSYYEQISDVGRDQAMTRDALEAFGELVRRFPDTDYARDAQLKIDLAQDHLAGKEMYIGRYYQERRQYVAAINRFRSVIEQFQTTTHVPEALHRLTETYLAIGVVQEAQNSAAVLGYNYPDSSWYQSSYTLLENRQLDPLESDNSWLKGILY